MLLTCVHTGVIATRVYTQARFATPVEHFGRLGGIVPEPAEIVEALKDMISRQK